LAFAWGSMLTLALDLGSQTGFAMVTEGKLSYGMLDLRTKGKFQPSGFKRLFDWLKVVALPHMDAGHTDMEVVMEKAHAGKFFRSVEVLFGLMAVVSSFCDTYGVPLRVVSAMTIKKHWSGTGKAKKEDMVAVTQKKYPDVKNHNTSDAIALLHYHLETR
jgi:Holliday junction resolvasome RuvABC endonuclease subunit